MPGSRAFALCRWYTPPFPDAMPCRLPPPLFILCAWFVAGILGPYHAIHCRRIVCHRITVHYAVTAVVSVGVTLLERSNDGPQWAAYPRQSWQSCHPLWAVWWPRWIFPPLSQDQSNEVIGGGDFHQSSILPLFSGSLSFCMPPWRPGFALERKETMTTW